MVAKARDPFEKHICAVTPRGAYQLDGSHTPHNRWISILEIGAGTIPYSAVIESGPPPSPDETHEDFFNQSFSLGTTYLNGGIIDALWKEKNVFNMQTENVVKFSIWLHPKMVDFSSAIQVTVDGKTKQYRATPSLLAALRSYERRRDWGLIYYKELVIDIKDFH